MKPIRFATLAATGLALSMTLVGTHPAPLTTAQTTLDIEAKARADKAAARVREALAGGQAIEAVAAAEQAVENLPRDAAMRFLLGRAYLAAGRFTSAETSFSDALTLNPNDARAGLNLALAEIAQGKREKAVGILNDFRGKLTASDLGLGLALAGDVNGAVATLEDGIRAGENSVKVRQNLALAYAMQGNWPSARVMAMQDLPEEQAAARLAEWTNFVRPASSFDQVASLLGVKPVSDGGQPTRLALNGTAAPAQRVVVNVETTPSAESVSGEVIDTQALAEADGSVQTLDTASQAARFETPVAAELSQAPAVPVVRAEAAPAKQALAMIPPPSGMAPMPAAPARRFESGKFVVQLGAYRSVNFSREAWGRFAKRYSLRGYQPGNAQAKVKGTNFVRLTVGGFGTRAEAISICTRIQSAGGSCFVRGRIGDQLAGWMQREQPKAKVVKTNIRYAKNNGKRPSRTTKPVRVASR